jgi:protein-L-isoaspartate(D-aspartate) O-methyltransferase
MDSKSKNKPQPVLTPQSARHGDKVPGRIGGVSFTSERFRANLVNKLKILGIRNQQVLDVMGSVPRHEFVDEALASRAYEDAALPIGHEQTISRPFTVARFAEYALQGRTALESVLEVGAGCGYQAAVLSRLAKRVVSIERIEALYQKAHGNLKKADVSNVLLLHGDGLQGVEAQAPFDVVLVAAAGLEVPQVLLSQLKVGGRLIVPVADSNRQVLVIVDRLSEDKWHRENKDLVKFVPLLKGTRQV